MGDSTPICRCRVLYLGSAVPRQSKDGLQGIQEPLRSLYPSEGAIGAKGIDSWLSVWSNGILLENVDENLKEITRFFPIESLHYCAAVRQVLIPERGNSNPEPKFLPLDSPFARMPRAQHPPIFAAILRRTTGIKVLECHVFICKREAAANALVRCCFHAYADNSYARQLETSSTGGGAGSSVYGTLKSNMASKSNGDLTSVGLSNGNSHHHFQQQHLSPSSASHAGWRSRAGSITTLNSVGRQSNGHLTNGGGGDNTSSTAEGYTSVKNSNRKSASKWEQSSERALLEVWRDRISELRGCRKNSHIIQEIAAEMQLQGYSYSVMEIKTKMNNMTARYRKEKQHMGTTGGSPSEWDLYKEMEILLAPYKSYHSENLVYDNINLYGSSADINVAVDDGDASLYNGDANHKVWNGSHDQLDSIVIESPYDMYSGNTSTLGRPARLRQISQPIDVPPPPMKEERSKKKKEKKSSKSSSSQSLSGTLIRPKPIHPATLQRHGIPMGPGPGSMIYGALRGPPPPQPPIGRNYHTISHRGFPPGPPLPQHHHVMPPQLHTQMMHAPPHHMGVPMQVPLMMPQQYATLQPSASTKKKKKEKKNTGIPVGMPIVPPIYAYHHAQAMGGPPPPPPSQSIMAQSIIGEPRPLAMSSRKLAASMGNGLDDSGNSGAESPGGTGIYRRKGHLNERAFSYSIRQEHRSRSHGSLASLQFNPPDMKKEREIAQMVAGLELNDGPEDPRSMGPATLQRKQAAIMNGNGVIYGNGGGQAIYGNGPSSSFGKPRR